MYFNILHDTGSEIFGYLIPDNFTLEPSISIHINGVQIGTYKCDIYLESPHKLKHHLTGIVGFKITDSLYPALSMHMDLEIRDTETGFVFYRRFDPERHIPKRVFRLETQFAPQNILDHSLKSYFQFYAVNMDRYGAETIRQCFEVINQSSTYVSGRVYMNWCRQFLSDDTITFAALRDPFYEFAIRLVTISQYEKRQFRFLPARDVLRFQPAIEYFADLNISDMDNIASAIKKAPKDVMGLFRSPFTQQLVAKSPSDDVQLGDVASALQVLSQFSVFDPDEDYDRYPREISELLSLPANVLSIGKPADSIQKMGQELKSIKSLEALLETDLILYHFIKKAERDAGS